MSFSGGGRERPNLLWRRCPPNSEAILGSVTAPEFGSELWFGVRVEDARPLGGQRQSNWCVGATPMGTWKVR